MIPNDPQAFSNTPGFGTLPGGQFGTTLSGQPGTIGTGPSGLGNLTGTPNYVDDAPPATPFRVRLSPPCGMTDTQFINAILAAFASYKNNLPYQIFPSAAAGTYNSNSFAAGILIAAGKKPPVLSLAPFFQAPGYDRPIPIGNNTNCICRAQ